MPIERLEERLHAAAVVAATVLASLAASLAGPAGAQSLRLAIADEVARLPAVAVGDTVTIELHADLQGVAASGVAAYVTVPEVFDIVDQGRPGHVGVQPFRLGPLFGQGLVAANRVLPAADPVSVAVGGQQLELAIVMGGSAVRVAKGVVATVDLRARTAADAAEVRLDESPVRESRLVLSDGRTERAFRSLAGLALRLEDPVASPVAAVGWGHLKHRLP